MEEDDNQHHDLQTEDIEGRASRPEAEFGSPVPTSRVVKYDDNEVTMMMIFYFGIFFLSRVRIHVHIMIDHYGIYTTITLVLSMIKKNDDNDNKEGE